MHLFAGSVLTCSAYTRWGVFTRMETVGATFCRHRLPAVRRLPPLGKPRSVEQPVWVRDLEFDVHELGAGVASFNPATMNTIFAPLPTSRSIITIIGPGSR